MPRKKVDKTPVPGKMRRFVVEFAVTIDVSQTVIDAVLTDEWRNTFYNLHLPEQVAEHLAYNLMRDIKITSLDGFADQPEEAAVHVRTEHTYNTIEEDIPKPKRKKKR